MIEARAKGWAELNCCTSQNPLRSAYICLNHRLQNMDLLTLAQVCGDKFITSIFSHLHRPNIQAIQACDASGKQSSVPGGLFDMPGTMQRASLSHFKHVQTVFLQLLGLESTTEATGRSLAGSLIQLGATSRYVSCKIASFTDFAPQKLLAAPSTSSLL